MKNCVTLVSIAFYKEKIKLMKPQRLEKVLKSHPCKADVLGI